MVWERRQGKRKPVRNWVFGRPGRAHPVGKRLGHPYLPPHWRPEDDADEAVRRREEIELMEELEQSGALYRIIW